MKFCFDFRNIFFLTLELLIINSSLLISEIRYVSKTGSSQPPYTSWLTAADSIQKCINISNFGDTIYVANGVYKEKVVMKAGLSLIGGGMDSCIIDTRQIQFTSSFFTILLRDNCYASDIRTFTSFSAGQPRGAGIGIGGENCTLENTRSSIAAEGISNWSNAFNIIQDNIISDVEDGIICYSQNYSLVKNNIIYPTSRGLVSQIFASPTYVNNTIISNAIVAGFTDWGDVSILKNNLFFCNNYAAYGFQYSYHDVIINNVVWGKWGYGILTAGSEVKNNHIEKTSKAIAFDNFGGNQPPVVQYNNLWNNENNFLNFNGDSTNIFRYPMFVKPDSMDFHLQKYSPLIDAGDPNILDNDGTRSDIGLFGGPFGEIYNYSDLPPTVPKNFTVTNNNDVLTFLWNRNHESDFKHYKVYRDTTKNFTIDSTKLIAYTADTTFVETISNIKKNLYYKLTAVDSTGNESEPSEEIGIILVSNRDEVKVADEFQLYQNYPNPFNITTKISYKLKQKGYVKIYVYDIKGELLEVLLNKVQAAGYYELDFIPPKESPSGLYVYQMMVIGENRIPIYNEIKKMLLIK